MYWVSDKWQDYELLDCSRGERLERWGDFLLRRPDPQVIWDLPRRHYGWHNADAVYLRSNTGGGEWKSGNLPEKWQIRYDDLTFSVGLMNFKHTGIFPEQAANWDFLRSAVKDLEQPNVLNLFAYTGASTVALASAGAKVCHVDAARGMVSWARQNAKLSGLEPSPVRWIVDDCLKFVQREIKRGIKYDAVIMDPPSYGRGPGGEVWKLEDGLFALVSSCAQLLSDNAVFFLINSYTTGLSPSTLGYVLGATVSKRLGGNIQCAELGLPVTESGLVLPCGACARWSR